MAYAVVERYHGEPAIVIDGVAYPPMAMTTPIEKRDYLRALGESGLRVFFLAAETSWFRPGGDGERSGFEQLRERAEMLLDEVPEAYIIVRIGMHPPDDWVRSHPEDIMRYDDGSIQEAIVTSELHESRLPGMYSLCSEAWREDGSAALTAFCDEVDRSSFGDRVIGYFLAAGGTSEWYPCNQLTDRARGRVADYSPAFRAEYERVLREKYRGDVQALRAAWNDPDAAFESPPIPGIDERRFVDIDERILDAFLHYESAARIVGKELDINPNSAYNRGVFLDADHHSAVADFYYAWHRGTANTILRFAEVIKRRRAGILVGAFYGSYGCTNFFNASTAGATLALLDSGLLDFLAAPGVYNNREPGGLTAQREMQDSFRLRDQLFIVEEDSRTHRENDFYRDAMGLYHVQDAIDILKRDFARNVCEDIYAWWFDQHEGGGRYMHPDIYALFRRQQAIALEAYALDRTKHNDIALLYDQESLFYVSSYTNALMLDYYRTSDLGRIGAPVDYYFHDDVARDDMPDYKLYVAINLFALTGPERDALHRKAAKNGATVLWLYAPGFIAPDRERKMDDRYIEELTGFAVERIDDTVSPRFRLEGAHPATRYGDPDRKYGYIDRDVHSNVWLAPMIAPPYANPFFAIVPDDGCEVLGRYLVNDKVAYAIKRHRGFVSAYCTAQIARSELIASLAEYAGCHLYLRGDDCLYANENYVTVHAQDTGERTLRFKRACSPYEVYQGRYYGSHVTEVRVPMRKGETLMFRLDR